MNKTGLPLPQLNKLLKKWQNKLLLKDWKLFLQIVHFNRKDFKQSGDIKVYPKKKKAIILLSNNPFRNEEETIVHELIHLLFWDFDHFCEKTILKQYRKFSIAHNKYLAKLEKQVESLTQILVKNK